MIANYRQLPCKWPHIHMVRANNVPTELQNRAFIAIEINWMSFIWPNNHKIVKMINARKCNNIAPQRRNELICSALITRQCIYIVWKSIFIGQFHETVMEFYFPKLSKPFDVHRIYIWIWWWQQWQSRLWCQHCTFHHFLRITIKKANIILLIMSKMESIYCNRIVWRQCSMLATHTHNHYMNPIIDRC